MFAARTLAEGRASSSESLQPSSTAQSAGPTRTDLGDFSEPKKAVSGGHLQGSLPLLLPASPKLTISVSRIAPGLGLEGVVEVPGFLCWSLRFISCWRVVPACGLLSLGFSPTATRGWGKKRPEINQMSKTRGKEPCSPPTH